MSYSKFKAELYSYYTDFDFHVKYELWALTLSWEGGKCVFYISFKWNKHKSKPDFDVFKRSLIPVKGGSQWAGLNSFLICNSFSFASDFYSSVWGPILHALHKSRERERRREREVLCLLSLFLSLILIDFSFVEVFFCFVFDYLILDHYKN